MQAPGQLLDESEVVGEDRWRRTKIARPIQDRGQPEIEKFRHAVRRVADIPRLDIAMQHAGGVHAVEGISEQRAQIDRLVDLQWTTAKRIEQRAAVEILEDQK